MFGTVNSRALDKPTTMTFAHLALLAGAIGVLVAAPVGRDASALAALTLSLIVPSVTVFYRRRSSVGSFSIVRGTLLYELYYLARGSAMLALLGRLVRTALPRSRGLS